MQNFAWTPLHIGKNNVSSTISLRPKSSATGVETEYFAVRRQSEFHALSEWWLVTDGSDYNGAPHDVLPRPIYQNTERSLARKANHALEQKVAAAWSRSNLPPPELDTIFRGIEAVYKANRSLLAKLKEIGTSPSSPKALGDLLMRWIDDHETPYTIYCTRLVLTTGSQSSRIHAFLLSCPAFHDGTCPVDPVCGWQIPLTPRRVQCTSPRPFAARHTSRVHGAARQPRCMLQARRDKYRVLRGAKSETDGLGCTLPASLNARRSPAASPMRADRRTCHVSIVWEPIAYLSRVVEEMCRAVAMAFMGLTSRESFTGVYAPLCPVRSREVARNFHPPADATDHSRHFA
ncbi:hypothetical protein GGX14DRAFT_573302 [Mycena pura]|uniref:Uncharacterized protein n=1 Tax=Mycena pura TaxID=153505 RepID=A0AAD6V095_9AGAR|nr:hypothetical protein GGX14DRAFT_573302 [Mycena pura]